MENVSQQPVNPTNAVPSLDDIAAKMTVMRDQTQRNQMRQQTETGSSDEAKTESPVAPEGEVITDEVIQPEDSNDLEQDDVATEESVDPEQDSVSSEEADSTSDELIDFIEFAETNPNAKFKFMRNGKEVVIDAKKAAAILGQGGAIHEEARQLKIERAEFDEFLKEQKNRQESLTLAMEFTVQPQLEAMYSEIIKTQGYQEIFAQQLQQTQDPAQIARIQSAIEQNDRYIQSQSDQIQTLKPRLDLFREQRSQQVKDVVERSRKAFTDKDLKNQFVFDELRTTIEKNWKDARGELVPGVSNIDLVSSDEYLLGLLRDGLKFRDKPKTKSAGSSIAALTSRKTTSATTNNDDNIVKLREQAKGGDKKAADNLLVAQLAKIRAARK
jgi:hypothetical protein